MIVQSAKLFGWVFLAVGILGFIPGITVGAHLLGIFHVNAAHNLVHIISGVVFLWAAYKSECAAMRAWQGFSVVYGLITIAGIVAWDATMIGPIAINMADTLLHLVITVFAVYCGFLERVRHPVNCHA